MLLNAFGDAYTSDDRRAAARFRALLASAAQGMIGVDGQGTIQLINPRAEEMFGYEPGELLGRNIGVLVPERVREVHAEELDRYSERPRSRPIGIGVELKGRRRDGSEFPVEISLNHLPVGDDNLVLGLVSDISERAAMEENARRARTMDAVGQLAGGVARQLQELQPADEISVLIGQLLAIAGAQTAEPQWFDPNQRLHEMRGLLSRVLGPEIHVQLSYAEDLGEILADPLQFEHVIVNLARNARDAMPDGGIMSIETAAIEVGEADTNWLLPVNPGPHVRVTVADTGIAMTREVLEHLFEPFFTTRAGQTTGIALATVYGILKSSDGSISVSSEPGHGSMFRVILPRVRENR